MKANKDICHPIVSNNERSSIKIDYIEVESSDCQKLLRIKLTQNSILRITM